MVYSNLISRILISFIFVALYIFLLLYKFELFYYFIVLIYLVILLEIIIYFKKFRTLIFIYLLVSFLSLYYIDLTKEGLIKFNLMILIIISFDIFSYLVGSIIGKTKILPYISPNKTLEGLVGGFLFSCVISFIYIYNTKINFNSYYIIFLICITASSFLGDIIESKFKRLNNLKNSSNFLLGHGGFFDRFDSFILSIIMYSFLTNLL